MNTFKSRSKSTKKTSSSSDNISLDLETVIKATRSISSEIEMDILISKLLKIVIENAGAEKGILLLLKDGKLFIEGEAFSNDIPKNILNSIVIDDYQDISGAIVRYVLKLNENVVLDNATEEGQFTNDLYISKNSIKSVLCSPIHNHGDLIGVIYLENNLTTGAFTKNRIEMINVLAAQIAISIENARLIKDMKDKARLQQEMKIAERIQTSLIPKPPIHQELEIDAVMCPASEVGGDYYDITTDKDGNTWFAIGDVTGHGVTPGLIMMMAETSFNCLLKSGTNLSPKDVINNINVILNMNVRERLGEAHFMTMNLIKYCGGGKFIYTGAHLDIIVWRAETRQFEFFKTEGLYLAIIPDTSKIHKDAEIILNSGDIMFLYTDGVIESRKKDDKLNFFGIENLCKTIEHNIEKNISEIKDAVLKNTLDWCGNVPADDITMIIIKMK